MVTMAIRSAKEASAGSRNTERQQGALRLLILGATGGTGRALLEQARRKGHLVTAFVRSPDKLAGSGDGVTVRPGDPHSVAELRDALPGHDAVLSALGAGAGYSTLLRDCAASTVAAMREAGVRRLMVVSAAVLFPEAPLGWLMRRTFLRNVAQDSTEMERIVMASGLEWTIARPPRLTNGPRTGRYRVADGRLPRRGFIISRADVADFMLGELERGEHLSQIVGLAR
jgi:putative NADH-flavin reductase